jgi:hypothetical protein
VLDFTGGYVGAHSIDTPPEELAAKYGYSLDQARQIVELMKQDSGVERPLNLRTFQLAKKYQESGNVLGQHMNTAKNANAAPGMIMCLSFALELFFKSLVLLDRDDVLHIAQLSKTEREQFSIHSIPLLYDQIPDQHKNRLSDIYSARMGVPRLPPARFRSELVEQASNVFLTWRYAHERNSSEALHLNLSVVENLIVAAQLVAVEAKQKPA